MANFGRDTSKSYMTFLQRQDRLAEEINQAITDGIKPIKIAYDVMGRCSSREAQVHLLTVLNAMAHLKKIPESLLKPFEEGIRPKRV